jgi:hypothetical protein
MSQISIKFVITWATEKMNLYHVLYLCVYLFIYFLHSLICSAPGDLVDHRCSLRLKVPIAPTNIKPHLLNFIHVFEKSSTVHMPSVGTKKSHCRDLANTYQSCTLPFDDLLPLSGWPTRDPHNICPSLERLTTHPPEVRHILIRSDLEPCPVPPYLILLIIVSILCAWITALLRRTLCSSCSRKSSVDPKDSDCTVARVI